jgi:molecular chaperone DnaK
MKASLENLSKIGAELYQQAQAAGAAGAPPEGGAPGAAEAGGAGASSDPKAAKKSSAQDGKVVDADVEIVDEEKK